MDKKILICVATDTEQHIVNDFCNANSLQGKPFVGSTNTYISYGSLLGHEIVVARSLMGSGSQGGATLTIRDALDEIKPYAVFNLGIAFGLKSGEQKLTDVLVAQQVQMYELQKITASEIYTRGDKEPTSPLLIGRVNAAKINRHTYNIHCGLFLSGEKLISSPSFKTELLKLFPEAIGGDMESAGIYSACGRVNIPCVTIKGISDWAESKTDGYQTQAATNAVSLFFDIMKNTGW